MSVKKLGKIAVVGLSAAWLAGCANQAAETDAASLTETEAQSQVETAPVVEAEQGSADQSFGAGEDNGLTSVIIEGDNGESATTDFQNDNPLAGVDHVFYFDFDKSIVRPEAREALAIHAKFLVDNPDARVVLEGHADERGTREYNMALGERRAKAVSRYLTIQGVAAAQIETVSFGEEQPVSYGHDEESWQINRRVEVRYE